MYCIGGERMLQSGVPKIYGGSSRCVSSRGSGGIPQENFES